MESGDFDSELNDIGGDFSIADEPTDAPEAPETTEEFPAFFAEEDFLKGLFDLVLEVDSMEEPEEDDEESQAKYCEVVNRLKSHIDSFKDEEGSEEEPETSVEPVEDGEETSEEPETDFDSELEDLA